MTTDSNDLTFDTARTRLTTLTNDLSIYESMVSNGVPEAVTKAMQDHISNQFTELGKSIKSNGLTVAGRA